MRDRGQVLFSFCISFFISFMHIQMTQHHLLRDGTLLSVWQCHPYKTIVSLYVCLFLYPLVFSICLCITLCLYYCCFIMSPMIQQIKSSNFILLFQEYSGYCWSFTFPYKLLYQSLDPLCINFYCLIFFSSWFSVRIIQWLIITLRIKSQLLIITSKFCISMITNGEIPYS